MNKETKDVGPNLSQIKIEASHCYRCGHLFAGKGRKKSWHHSIPRFLKPKRNVLIPVCEMCHQEMNQYTVQSIPNFDNIRTYIVEMEKFLIKWKKKLRVYDKENGENEEKQEEEK